MLKINTLQLQKSFILNITRPYFCAEAKEIFSKIIWSLDFFGSFFYQEKNEHIILCTNIRIEPKKVTQNYRFLQKKGVNKIKIVKSSSLPNNIKKEAHYFSISGKVE